MAITSLAYEAPIRRMARRENLDYELLETAVELADEGKHLEALTKTFNHFFPNHTIPDFTKEAFAFTQGSSKVTTKLEGDDVLITVPLVKLPQGGSAIAALRYVLTRIAATGQLYQPRLRGDDIYLEFRDALSRLHPAKVVEVLRRMPTEADNSDDFLIGQFGAQPLDRAEIAELTDDELTRSEKIWQQHWADVEELVKECQRKRSIFFLNETTAYALHRIHFALPIGGFLASRLSEAADIFNDCDEDPLKRESTLAKTAKELKGMPKAELKKSLAHATYALSPLDDGTPKVLRGYIGPGHYIETISELKGSGKTFEAALAMISTYNYLLARHSWPEEMEVALKQGLEAASGKPWREASTLLFDHAKSIVEEFTSEEDDDDEDEDEDEDDDDEDDEDDEDEEEEEGDES